MQKSNAFIHIIIYSRFVLLLKLLTSFLNLKSTFLFSNQRSSKSSIRKKTPTERYVKYELLSENLLTLKNE